MIKKGLKLSVNLERKETSDVICKVKNPHDCYFKNNAHIAVFKHLSHATAVLIKATRKDISHSGTQQLSPHSM